MPPDGISTEISIIKTIQGFQEVSHGVRSKSWSLVTICDIPKLWAYETIAASFAINENSFEKKYVRSVTPFSSSIMANPISGSALKRSQAVVSC